MKNEISTNQADHEITHTLIQSIIARYLMAYKLVKDQLSYHGNERWFDIGSNKGFGLDQIPSDKIRVFAIDINHAYLIDGKQRNPSVNSIEMDGRHLGFPKSSFNVVSLFEVIEHLDEEGQKTLLKGVYRVMTDDGRLILSTPNKGVCGSRRRSPDHQKELDLNELTNMLSMAGFTISQTLSQGFLSDNLLKQLFSQARDSLIISHIYYNVIPWFLRSKIKNFFLKNHKSDEIREAQKGETAKNWYLVCKKSV